MNNCVWCNTPIEGTPVWCDRLRYHPHCFRELTDFFERNAYKHVPTMKEQYDWNFARYARKAIAEACYKCPELRLQALQYACARIPSDARELFPMTGVRLERLCLTRGETVEEPVVAAINYLGRPTLAFEENWGHLMKVADAFGKILCVDRIDIRGRDGAICVTRQGNEWDVQRLELA